MIPTNFLATRVGTSVDYDRAQTLSQLDINVFFNKHKHYHSLTSYLTMRLPSSSIWNVYILSGTPDKSSLQEPILLVSDKKGVKSCCFYRDVSFVVILRLDSFEARRRTSNGSRGGSSVKKLKRKKTDFWQNRTAVHL